MRRNSGYLLVVMCVAAGVAGWAQGRNIGFDWPTTGADAQRTSWHRLDPNITVEGLSKPGFEFLWREKLNNAPRGATSISQGVTMNGLLGFTPASFVTGASNVVFALDNDTGFPVWQRRFDAPLPAVTDRCPGGITGAPARVTGLTPDKRQVPAPPAPRGGYRGALGPPGEGVPLELARRDGGAGLRGASPIPTAPGRGGGGVGAGRYPGPIYTISSAGTLHALGQVSGIDVQRPTPFLPANARYSDLTAIGEMLYTSTSENCGGVPNGVWGITLDAENKGITSWRTNGGSPVGNLAFTTAGKVLVAIGSGAAAAGGYANAIVALDPKTLQPTDWFTSPSTEFVTTPVVITLPGREVVAAATRDGRILLFDVSALGGANHMTPLFASQPLASDVAPDAMASFEGEGGTRWLLVPLSRAIAAFKVVPTANGFALEAGWTSRAIASPAAPIVVNDVVFAAASGRPKGAAVLYALDSRSGRELWTSGKTMTSYIAGASLWASNSQVHVATHDGTVYAFGFVL
jgi:outer membrane protein assembly factor BamB